MDIYIYIYMCVGHGLSGPSGPRSLNGPSGLNK
jgi:hypothetical protein